MIISLVNILVPTKKFKSSSKSAVKQTQLVTSNSEKITDDDNEDADVEDLQQCKFFL
jgi:hypothetical protein